MLVLLLVFVLETQGNFEDEDEDDYEHEWSVTAFYSVAMPPARVRAAFQ